MGQVFPLPERIPNPRKNKRKKMEAMGFVFKESEAEYVEYEAPKEWRLIDQTLRRDQPDWVFVDEKNLVRITICGSWKGDYDNKLSMSIVKDPYLFVPKENDHKDTKNEGQSGASIAIDTQKELETKFIERRQKYFSTLDSCKGCGDRALTFINKAYDQMKEAWDVLSNEQKKLLPLPIKK